MDASTDTPPAEQSRRHLGEEQRSIDRMWDFADPIATEQRFREASEDETLSAHRRTVMRTQAARAIALQEGRLDDALALLEEVAEALSAALGAPDAAELRARVGLERGRALAAAERAEEALPLLTRAVRDGAAAGSSFLVLDALHLLALHDAGHEEEWAVEGFELLDEVRDPRVLRWGVALHDNLGWLKHDADDAVAALHHFTLAAEAAERYGTAGQLRVARWSVARALRSLGRLDEALAIQETLLADDPEDPYVRAELAALTGDQPTIEE